MGDRPGEGRVGDCSWVGLGSWLSGWHEKAAENMHNNILLTICSLAHAYVSCNLIKHALENLEIIMLMA